MKIPQRKLGQIWAYCSWESPEHYGYPAQYSKWKDQFNWTVGYRTDADCFFPNSYMTWRDPRLLLDEQEYLTFAKGKTKMVAWFVSNCRTSSQREKYVKEMQKYIQVDICGKCSNKSCSKSKLCQCEKMLTKDYYFYLRFENSLCQDYVTEKFFRTFAFRTHSIPVGRSGFDYNKYIPGNIVVDASKFKSAKGLVLYLKELANDWPRYVKMLQEKERLLALNGKVDWCDACEKLQTKQYRNHIYEKYSKMVTWS